MKDKRREPTVMSTVRTRKADLMPDPTASKKRAVDDKEDQHESTIRPCKYGPGHRAAALMERWPGQAIDRRIRDDGHQTWLAGVRPDHGTHRRIRQRRHALGGATDIFPGLVRLRPHEATGPATSGLENQGAVRLGPQRR